METHSDKEPEEKKDVSRMTSKEFQEYKKSLEDLYNTQIKDP